MRGIIDRFEGDFAVTETEEGMKDIPRSSLPPEAKEGSVIEITEDSIILDEKTTEERTKRIRTMMDELFGKTDRSR